ncbi:uncharacterized protein RAG0_12429 [Rhynchosporium agropyri]|uniref:Uncharacterized protein n=1 Tax=Rhynchosporium agropyri TaxID=914238 RepID=A0A1E1L8R8_9HELO|nr:uncharacterized protein RAG0_12429 [Rhynchosporium agropyri]
MALYDTSLDSNGSPVMYTTWYSLPSDSSTSVEATTTTLATITTSEPIADSISSATKGTNASSTSYTTGITTPPADLSPSSVELPVRPKTVDIYTLPPTISNCSSLTPGETLTIWSIVPNTTVVTVTVTDSYSTTLLPTPEFTPPTYCPELPPLGAMPFIGTSNPNDATDSAVASSSTDTLKPVAPMPAPTSTRPTITVITTSKNAVTITTKATLPTFPGRDPPEKQTVDPGMYTDSPQLDPLQPPPLTQNPPGDVTTIVNAGRDAKTRVTFVRDSMTLVVSPHQAVVGGQVIDIGLPPKTITEGGDVFTIGPNMVEGPMLQILVPTYTGNGGVVEEPPKTTTVQGVPIQLKPSEVVIGGDGGGTTTIPLMPGARPTTLVVKEQTISIGSGGIGFSGTTITPPPSMPTNVVVVGGQGFSAIGSSVAVIGGTTFVYGPGIEPKTVALKGEAITVGPQGVVFDGTTIGGPLHATGTQYAVAGGLTISEIGSTLAVINGMTLTLGPGATPMTQVIGGQTITAGPNGVVIDGATLTIPFNTATQAVTAGGITFTQVGGSLAVIGGKTYTFGPGAQQTSTVIDGQTISIGPGGVGFQTTTFTGTTATSTSTTSATETSTAKSTSKKKSGAERLDNGFGLWGIWTGICTSVVLSRFFWLG